MLCPTAGVAVGSGVLAYDANSSGLMVAAALILLGFAVSGITGMLFKVLPFLVWLHLTLIVQAQGATAGKSPRSRRSSPAGRHGSSSECICWPWPFSVQPWCTIPQPLPLWPR
jgi:hypothetical protein